MGRGDRVVALAAGPRLWAAWFTQSVFWPDEIYQSLEPAHNLAFGYGWVAWEWQQGARSWVFPAFFAGLWKVAGLQRTW